MTKNYQRRNVEELAESLKAANGQCVFLIGAGFSHSAGIPLAGALVEEIKRTFPLSYDRAETKSYNHVMGELTPQQRIQLLSQYIECAKVNWAHIALAALFEQDKIDRILTVNFDPLILKACSMVGEFPAVYDLATASEFKSNRIAPKSVFYLNGQHTGFSMLNSEEELEEHKERLREIVNQTGVSRIWVVVGYSGDADPLSEILAEVAERSFDNGLYWVGHSNEPSERQLNLLKHPNAYYIGNQDADKFADELAKEMECFPPDVLVRPFDYIENLVTKNIDFNTGGEYAASTQNKLKGMIDRAKFACENQSKMRSTKRKIDTSALVMSGKYDELIKYWNEDSSQFDEDQREDVAWAFLLSGNLQLEEANDLLVENLTLSRDRWSKAGEKYANALSIKPNMSEALNNWGNALISEAQAILNDDRGRAFEMWAEAEHKFSQALSIKPGMYQALSNWGNMLANEAIAILNDDRVKAFEKWAAAIDKYTQALSIKPDLHEVLNNWGIVLDKEAQALLIDDRDKAFEKWAEAGDKYAEALSIKSDLYETLNNWGSLLDREGRALLSDDRDKALEKWAEAGDKYALALLVKPDMHTALNNWGLALAMQAQVMSTDDRSKAFDKWAEAGEKYALALSIKPDKHEALNNWGNALGNESKALLFEDRVRALKRWAEAREKYAQALSIKPDKHETLFNWGVALAEEAKVLLDDDREKAFEKWTKAGEKYAQALLIKPDKYDALSHWGDALGEEAETLLVDDRVRALKKWAEACEKYAQALIIKPDFHSARNHLIFILLRMYHAQKDDDHTHANNILNEVHAHLESGVALIPCEYAYHYACYFALKNNAEECIQWLEEARKNGKLPSQEHVDCDEDFDLIRNSAEFQGWYNMAFCDISTSG